MTPTFKKLNFKDQLEICIVNSPAEFLKEVNEMKKIVSVKTDSKECKEIEFVLTFVTTKSEIDKIAPAIDKKLAEDGIVWFAYPKGTSKKYKSEINRDKGWESIRKLGFDTVRAVAIDNDWSALRFRRVEFIKATR